MSWTTTAAGGDTEAVTAALARVAADRADVETLRRAVAGGREGASALHAAEYRLNAGLRALDRLRETGAVDRADQHLRQLHATDTTEESAA